MKALIPRTTVLSLGLASVVHKAVQPGMNPGSLKNHSTITEVNTKITHFSDGWNGGKLANSESITFLIESFPAFPSFSFFDWKA